MLDVTMIGFGAIGRSVRTLLRNAASVRIAQLVVTGGELAAARQACPDVPVATRIDELPARPQLVLECAGHGAVLEHVLPALRQGIDCVICSIGALAEPGLTEAIEAAASTGGARAQLLSGAIGGLDALAAGRVGGLADVTYTGRKPPHGWKGTPAEAVLDLDRLGEATVFFEGTAREAARQYPKNANVAATVSLAGIGLDRTRVRLIADPAVARNVHQVHARGAFGELEVTLRNQTLPDNPKTSALAVYSAVRALRDRVNPVSI